jgi:hypothetical protein
VILPSGETAVASMIRSPAPESADTMDQVPVGGRAFVGRVLAHRRDDDAIGEAEGADLERLEQMAHGAAPGASLRSDEDTARRPRVPASPAAAAFGQRGRCRRR